MVDRQVLGTLTDQELEDLWDIAAKLQAIEANPTAFSAVETVAAYRSRYSLFAKIHSRLQLEATENWTWMACSGVVIQVEDE